MATLLSKWYFWIPIFLIIVFVRRFVYYALTHAIVAELGFRGSKKDETGNYTTIFNVAFDFWFGKRMEMNYPAASGRGIVRQTRKVSTAYPYAKFYIVSQHPVL